MSAAAAFPDRAALEDAMTRLVLGELTGAEAGALKRLLAEDAELNAELESLRRTLDLLPYAAALQPPPQLKARVIEAARASRVRPSARAVPWWPMIAAAASLAAVALLAQNLSLRRELELQRDVAVLLQQPNVVLSFSLEGTGPNASAFGSVVLDLDAKKGAVVIRKLPALPPERLYRLWALIGNEKVACGQFNASAEQTVVSLFPVPVDAYTAPVTQLILTVESSPAPPQPAGPTVMVGSTIS